MGLEETGMTFWSSQKLEAHLARLTDDPDPAMIDCNALTLRVGPEYYVTPGLEHPSPGTHTKQPLDIGQGMTIPPGQFAFLLTEEKITIPPEVMGFISVKATYKLKGLVNVSGFHVDPGWSGRLIFTVFNAGPSTIHLERRLPVFLLWVADLESPSEKRKGAAGHEGIPPAIIGNITGVVDSIYALEKRVEKNIADVSEKQDAEITKIADKQEDFRKEVTELKERQYKILLGFGIAAVVAGAIVGASVKMLGDWLLPAAPAVIAAPAPVTGTTANDQAPPARSNATTSTNLPTGGGTRQREGSD
jgi:dCTP deaminase